MTRPRPVRATLVATVGAVALVGAAFAVPTSATAAPTRHAIAGSKPAWFHEAHRLHKAAAHKHMYFGLVLGMRHRSNAVATLTRISSPHSSSYGRWLTHKQFTARYAPSKATAAAARRWLRSQHFHVSTTLAGGMYIEATGTVARLEKTFGTSIATYRYKHRTVRANTHRLSLPADTPKRVVGAVTGVLGIDQGSLLVKHDRLPGPPPGTRYGVQPCSSYYGQRVATNKPSYHGAKRPYAVCGYNPRQLRSAYSEDSLINRGIDGRGVTVAITDAYASPTIYYDAQKYNRVYGQRPFRPGQFVQVRPRSFNVYDPADAQGWYGEETLDVEAVHAMAPGAKVVYVAGRDDAPAGLGPAEAWAETIDHHRADIITNSWGDISDRESGAEVRFFYQFALEGALLGITDNFSSGDDGDQTAGGTDLRDKAVDFPADVPFVTGVGGSSVLIGGSGQRLAEYGWQNAYSQLNAAHTAWGPAAYSSGGGGGTSRIFAEPWYQRRVVPGAIAHYYGATAKRVVPDIAMDSDPNTGMVVGETQQFPNGTYWDTYRIGGTSLGSPLLAGALALADQKAGVSLGFVNPLLYALHGTSAFYDTTAPNPHVYQVRTDYTNFVNNAQGKHYELQTVDTQSSTLKDRPGYDDETGVGTPGPTFASSLARYARP